MVKPRHNDRRCVATGDPLPPGAMALRFVLGPDGTLVPDLAEKLPGRGAWVTASADHLTNALKRGGFAKSFKAPVALPPEHTAESFVAHVGDMLAARVLDRVGMARRAGCVIAGFDTVRGKATRLLAYLTPSDAAPDGVRKITQVLEATGTVPHIPLASDSAALGRAIGDVGVVHIGLLPGKAATVALAETRRWCAFVGATGGPSA